MRRLPSWIVALALALAGVAVGHSPALAQQSSLPGVAGDVAGCWNRRDADGIAALLSKNGVALHLGDESHPAAGVRQARAALAEFLAKGGSARVSKVEDLGGSPQRGFAELSWDVQGLKYVVFVGFVREDDAWKIGEIRVLR